MRWTLLEPFSTHFRTAGTVKYEYSEFSSSLFLRGGGNRFSDRRISQEKIVRISDLANVLHGFRILLIQQIADLSNILARIADFASNLGGSADLYTPIHPPPPPSNNTGEQFRRS